jgi:hypothetical protein
VSAAADGTALLPEMLNVPMLAVHVWPDPALPSSAASARANVSVAIHEGALRECSARHLHLLRGLRALRRPCEVCVAAQHGPSSKRRNVRPMLGPIEPNPAMPPSQMSQPNTPLRNVGTEQLL